MKKYMNKMMNKNSTDLIAGSILERIRDYDKTMMLRNKEVEEELLRKKKLAELGMSCCVCFEENVSLELTKPCNHISSCSECLERMDTCPVCREPIEVVEKVYFM